MNNERIWVPTENVQEIMSKDMISPFEMREVLIDCFSFVHGDPETAIFILKKQAMDIGMNWSSPTKIDYERLIPRLVDVSMSFRNPDVIQANKQKFIKLLNRCECE